MVAILSQLLNESLCKMPLMKGLVDLDSLVLCLDAFSFLQGISTGKNGDDHYRTLAFKGHMSIDSS